MLASGRSFQFNISASLSFQLQTGFSSVSFKKPSAKDRMSSHRDNDSLAELRVKAQPAQFEVLEVYQGKPALVLPAAIVPDLRLSDHRFSRSEREYRQETAWDRSGCIQSYDNVGQPVFMKPEAGIIDVLI